MKKKDRDYVLNTIENEGFHYAFVHYSDFEEIVDPEFHKRREAYQQASRELADYVGAEE